MSLWERLLETTSSCCPNKRGTISPKVNFNAGEDVEALKQALEGIGTKEDVLIDILTKRSNAQRQLICKAYEKDTGRTLQCDLKGDTVGDFEDLLVALITPPAEYDCHEVMAAMKGSGTKENVLIEIFASRNNQQIRALNEVYLRDTEVLLIRNLRKEVSGDLCKALHILVEGKRDETLTADVALAAEDAQALYNAGEKKWGTDESKFIEILCQRSFVQLRRTLIEYKKLSGKTLQQVIEGEMSGDLEELLLAILKCVTCTEAYFAEQLHESMKGGGTDEATLRRIMVSRSEIDLMDIRAEFKELYGHSLLSALDSDVSGHYGNCLKAICGGDD